MTIKNLKTQYESICNEWVGKFATKQGLNFEGWVGGEVGGIADFIGQYYFNISDIVFDLTTKQPKDLILTWQDDSVEYMSANTENYPINYKSYTLGLRYDQLIKKP